jgi:predicted short-subunit dehydrogenase-like oxidoreductase (DUF2520 family)
MTSDRRRRPAPWRVAIVGRGKAALSLAASLRRARIPHTFHDGRAVVDVGAATLVVLAVSDGAIGGVAAALNVGAQVLVIHLAGSLGLSTLPPSLRRGAFHPLASLDGQTPIPDGALCAIDADDDDDRARLFLLAMRLRLSPARVTDAQRVRYHAGAVIAGNLATALLQVGIEQLMAVGIEADVARVSLARLLASTAMRAEAAPLSTALTGPVARGDSATVARHLAVLDGAAAFDDRQIYRLLTRVLIDRVQPPRAAEVRWPDALTDD